MIPFRRFSFRPALLLAALACIAVSLIAASCKDPNQINGPTTVLPVGNGTDAPPLLNIPHIETLNGVHIGLPSPYSVLPRNLRVIDDTLPQPSNTTEALITAEVYRSMYSSTTAMTITKIGAQSFVGLPLADSIPQIFLNIAERTKILARTPIPIGVGLNGHNGFRDYQWSEEAEGKTLTDIPNTSLTANFYPDGYSLDNNIMHLPPILDATSPKAGETIKRKEGLAIKIDKPFQYKESDFSVQVRLYNLDGFDDLYKAPYTFRTNESFPRHLMLAKTIASGATTIRFLPEELSQLGGKRLRMKFIALSTKATNNKAIVLSSYSERVIELQLTD